MNSFEGRCAIQAAADGNLAYLQSLARASPGVVNYREDRGEDAGITPLYAAVSRGSIEVSKWLLAHHADPNVADTDGRTPLHVAAANGTKELVSLLLEAGADPTARTADSESPKQIAFARGHGDAAKLLAVAELMQEQDMHLTPGVTLEDFVEDMDARIQAQSSPSSALYRGLSSDQARAWRRTFSEMDWWDNPGFDGAGVVYGLMKAEGLPTNPDDADDPWLFCCRLSPRAWGVKSVKAIVPKQSEDRVSSGYFFATRTRIGVVCLQSRRVWWGPYEGIYTCSVMGETVWVAFKMGLILDVSIKTKGPGLLNMAAVVMGVHGDDPALEYIGASSAAAARANRRDFMEILKVFLIEVAGPAKMSRGFLP